MEVEHRRAGRGEGDDHEGGGGAALQQATLAKAKVDVSVARADLAVAKSEAKRLEAWVGYLTLTAPFDGVIVARNANTFDFVLPATGDPTAMQRSPDLSPGGTAAPIYVVDRTDVVRIFVDIPEQDANYVQVGTKASVLAKAYRDEPIPGTVTRTSWALNVKSRTLRAEIDLPNPGSQLLPGMYAYAKVIIERPGVRALPVAALTHSGDKTFCWTYEDGHAVRTEIQTGVSDGEWIEVTNRRAPSRRTATRRQGSWTPIDGSEQVILGDLSILTDGAPVKVAPAESKVAKIAPARPLRKGPSEYAGSLTPNVVTVKPSASLQPPSTTRNLHACRAFEPIALANEATKDGLHIEIFNLTKCDHEHDSITIWTRTFPAKWVSVVVAEEEFLSQPRDWPQRLGRPDVPQ